jgi:hypothetical protein
LLHFEDQYWKMVYKHAFTVAHNIMVYSDEFARICFQSHPSIDPDRCTLIFTTTQGHKDLDYFWPIRDKKPIPKLFGLLPQPGFNPFRVFWNFESGPHEAWKFDLILRVVNHSVLVLGVILYLLGVKLEQRTFLTVCFVANILLSLPDLFLIQERMGIDTKAYIN